jgi:hypothetical protein
MPKDPAALFFIDKWLVATKEMKSDCRGWYLNLILHQFDKKDLPNDVEELANLADVRFSEYEGFKQTWQHVLQHKFQLNTKGRLENEYATEILRAREQFKAKRSLAGKMSVFIKYVRANLCQDENVIQFVKQHADLSEVDIKNQHMLKQVFEQTHQLYINAIVIENTINNKTQDGGTGEDAIFEPFAITDSLPLPETTLTAAEQNQFTITGARNTEFLQGQWKTFISERIHDPPEKRRQYRQLSDLTRYFLNWVRTKHPKHVKPGFAKIGKDFEPD